jgi:DNA-binding transcriptional LysR family regulator
MEKSGERVKIGGHYFVAIDDGNAYLTAGLAGLGVLWLPQYMAREHVASGSLVQLFTDWRIEPMPLHVAYPPNRYVRKQLRVFIDWIVELMARHE